MTDQQEQSDFQPFTSDEFDAMGKVVTENTNLEVLIDGGARKAYIFLVNESDNSEGERDTLDGALKIAKILGLPNDAVVASGYTVIKDF